jgi:hypothetical protein
MSRTHALDALIHAGIESSLATQLAGMASSRIVPIETIPAVRTSPIQRTKTHTPYPTQPYLAGKSRDLIPAAGSRSRSTSCRRSHSSTRDAPAAGVAARRRYQAPPPAVRSGRTWPLNAAADDDHGEEQDPDLARRGHGGSQEAAAPAPAPAGDGGPPPRRPRRPSPPPIR